MKGTTAGVPLSMLACGRAYMGFRTWFKRAPAIVDRDALVDFLQTRAALLIQKSIFEFARAATGRAFTGLMRDPSFIDAMDRSRWVCYPFGLSLVAETVHGALLPAAHATIPLAEALREAAFDAFDRYPIPKMLDAEFWTSARLEMGRRIVHVALHPPKRVKDIPLSVMKQIFENLPIHERTRGDVQEIVVNHLRLTLIGIYDDFVERADITALAHELGVAESADDPSAIGG
jgi:hypothetical protein